jgi:hypothetical protein
VRLRGRWHHRGRELVGRLLDRAEHRGLVNTAYGDIKSIARSLGHRTYGPISVDRRSGTRID